MAKILSVGGRGAGDLTLQSMQFGIEEYLPRLRSYSEESIRRVSPMTAN
jgi:hypothetical protein